MEGKKLTNDEKKYLAKILYTREKEEGKIIAKRIGVSEKTMSKWVTDGNWKSLRNRLLISKEEQINLLYGQLEKLNTLISESAEGYADTKQADIMIKLTAAIRNMETDLAIADLVESGIRFLKFLQQTGSMEQALEVSEFWNSFLHASIKK